MYSRNSSRPTLSGGGSVIATYGYDSSNRRIIKTVGTTTTHYLYDGSSNLIAETLADGTVNREYIYLDGEIIAVNDYQDTPGLYYYLNDHLGTPQQLVDASGTVVWQAAYLPFGKAQVGVADVVNNVRFPGQYFDGETGLHYNWHRYYDPSTGRYISADPIGLAGGINLYVYVDGDPINAIDPNGLAKICCRLLDSIAGSFGRKRHCYIKADDVTIYGLYPKDGKGVPRINDPRDKGGKCYDCPAKKCTDQNKCLKDAHNSYPVGNYDLLGPNSNTYAGNLARSCCDGGIPSGARIYSPGIRDNPPTP